MSSSLSPATANDTTNQEEHHDHSLFFFSPNTPQEQEYLEEVYLAFCQYGSFAQSQWINQQCRLSSLPESTRILLPPTLQKGTHEARKHTMLYKDACTRNQVLLDAIVSHANVPTLEEQEEKTKTTRKKYAKDLYVSKVSEILKCLYRDWSSEGRVERGMSYKPLLQDIQNLLPIQGHSSALPRLCVPGAGVGRLAYEFAEMGYCVQGNENSLFHLLALNFVLQPDACNPSNQCEISPWLLETRNVHGAKDPFRKVAIPDVDSSSILSKRQDSGNHAFSLTAGDFLSTYNHPTQHGQWDGIVSCFFLDTAPNMVEYLETMYNMLRCGGVLVNLGPFLHSWSGPAMRPDDLAFDNYVSRTQQQWGLDSRFTQSIDLCWEDVRHVLVNLGFVIEKEKTGVRALYTADCKSMMNMSYRCVHFVARKQKVGAVQTL